MSYLFEQLTGYYHLQIYTYLLLVFIVIGSLIVRYLASFNKDRYAKEDKGLLIVFITLIIFLCGTRSLKVGTDTGNYYYFYFLKGIKLRNPFEIFTYFDTDFFFEIIMFLTFPFRNFAFFTLVVSIIFNVSLYKFVRRYTNFSKDGSSLLFFLMLASSFVFYSHQVNTIRNALAMPFILFAMYYMKQKEYRNAIIYLIISYLCHKTSLIPIACILGAHIGRNIPFKYFLMLYGIGILMAAAGFGFNKIPFLTSIGLDSFQSLSFDGETTYRIGFRIDFVIYNSIFLFFFMKFGSWKNNAELFWVRYFILASIIFFLNFNIPFSDRIGAYSWLAIPLLLFTVIKHEFPNQHLYYSTLATLGYFTLNYIVLQSLL